jgi:hypothetical protein
MWSHICEHNFGGNHAPCWDCLVRCWIARGLAFHCLRTISLLTTLAKRSPVSVELGSDARLPELPGIATDPEEIEWTMTLPFDYGALSVEEVIRIISNSLGVRWSPTQDGGTPATVRMKLVEGKARDVFFQLVLMEGVPWGRRLRIERLE